MLKIVRYSHEHDARRDEACNVTRMYIIRPYSISFTEVNPAKLGSHEVGVFTKLGFSQSWVLIKLGSHEIPFSQS